MLKIEVPCLHRGKMMNICKPQYFYCYLVWYLDGLAQERRNSIANALELHLSCTNPSTLCYSSNFHPWLPFQYHLHVLYSNPRYYALTLKAKPTTEAQSAAFKSCSGTFAWSSTCFLAITARQFWASGYDLWEKCPDWFPYSIILLPSPKWWIRISKLIANSKTAQDVLKHCKPHNSYKKDIPL